MEQILDILCLNKFPRNVTNISFLLSCPKNSLITPERVILPSKNIFIINLYFTENSYIALLKLFPPR